MNLTTEKSKLIKMIENYLNGQSSLDDLNDYAWYIIDYFTQTTKEQLPPKEDFESAFWYTIWQVQHMADNTHEKDGLTKKTLSEALHYLEGRKKLPPTCIGERP